MDWTWEVRERCPMLTPGFKFAYLILNQIYRCSPFLLKSLLMAVFLGVAPRTDLQGPAERLCN